MKNFGNKKYKDFLFSIPEYQRPYKWTIENVNQLIDDIREAIIFKKNNNLSDFKYRIGTVVLHVENSKLNIVDGQQRFLSLNLIFRVLNESLDKSYNIERFISTFKNKFSSMETKRHLKTNYDAIRAKIQEIANLSEREEVYNFLRSNCEFVIVVLFDIGEAFQFFDSQNSRGKDLEPYDLLKAYHLRSIKDNYEDFQIEKLDEIENNAITNWEQLAATESLKELFILLFHILSWSKLNYYYFFTKDEIIMFKGLTEKKDVDLPPMFFASLYLLSKIKENNLQCNYENNKTLPFQIDFPMLNGEYFFYEVYKFESLYKEYNEYLLSNNIQNKTTKTIIEVLTTYEYKFRKGDQYIRHLLDCISVYYLSKFGFSEFDSVFIKFFEWAYMLRLKKSAIKR